MKYLGILLTLILIAFGAVSYLGTEQSALILGTAVKKVERVFISPPPCTEPILYSIGVFDTRFGVSKETFRKDIALAEEAWEKSAGKNLFEYSTTTSDFTVNLLYDERQKTTEILSEQKTDISGGKMSYDSLKAQFASLKLQYETKTAEYEKDADIIRAEQNDYQEKVDYWNKKGGAPKNVYEALSLQREEINRKIEALNRDLSALNILGEQLNSAVDTLNSVAKTVNEKVETYNAIAKNAGEEFSEGEYIRDEKGTRINVYQFDSKEKLIRVLEHELGHVLGMDHVEDQNAIMYRLNSGSGISLTKDDVLEMMRVCKGE